MTTSSDPRATEQIARLDELLRTTADRVKAMQDLKDGIAITIDDMDDRLDAGTITREDATDELMAAALAGIALIAEVVRRIEQDLDR